MVVEHRRDHRHQSRVAHRDLEGLRELGERECRLG
jgi:hypothetical protein